MDFEEYNTSTLKEKNEDNINQITLASAWALLNNDENDDMDWSEVELEGPEDSDHSNSF